jgi:hypothetical protein
MLSAFLLLSAELGLKGMFMSLVENTFYRVTHTYAELGLKGMFMSLGLMTLVLAVGKRLGFSV